MEWLKKYKLRKNLSKPNVVGAGTNELGETVFYVLNKVSEAALTKKEVIDKELAGKRTHVEERVLPKACATKKKKPKKTNTKKTASTIYKIKTRPYQPGQSISNYVPGQLSAGTLGLIGHRIEYKWGNIILPNWVGNLMSAKFLLKAGVELNETPVGVSNVHVVGELGNTVIQSGSLDGGHKTDKIGEVIANGKINGIKPIDIAVFKLTNDNFKTWPLNMRMSGVEVERNPNFERVKKSGRSSGLSYGTITAKNVSITVDMGEYGLVRFDDMIEVDGDSNGRYPLLIPGDSGSSVWTSDNKVVGIGFAAGPRHSYVIPIKYVTEDFGVLL